MSRFTDWERIMRRADRGLASLTAEQMDHARQMLRASMRRTLADVRVHYVRALTDLDGLQPGASFRLARALAVAEETEATIRSLGDPDIITERLADRLMQARVQAQHITADVYRVFGDPISLTTPMNHRAVASVVRESGTRLAAHGEDVIARVQASVTDGLVRGRSWQQVQRDIRRATGMQRNRARLVAHTELHSAQADARAELAAMIGQEYVIRYVTDDERTCGACAPRQGEVLRAADAIEVLHPFCRCVLSPFQPDWLLDGTLPLDELADLRSDTLATMRRAGTEPLPGAAPFERGRRRAPVWTPGENSLDDLRRLAA